MRTTVRLDDDLLHAAKIKAAKEGRTLTSLIEEGLKRVLESDRKSPRSAFNEERGSFDQSAQRPDWNAIVSQLPKDIGPSLLENAEYLRLAAKAGSTLPSRVLAVMDEEEDIDRLLRPDSTAG